MSVETGVRQTKKINKLVQYRYGFLFNFYSLQKALFSPQLLLPSKDNTKLCGLAFFKWLGSPAMADVVYSYVVIWGDQVRFNKYILPRLTVLIPTFTLTVFGTVTKMVLLSCSMDIFRAFYYFMNYNILTNINNPDIY